MDNTHNYGQGDTEKHKKKDVHKEMGTQEGRKGGRKEIKDRYSTQTNAKRFKSSPGIMRKVAQKEMQKDKTTQNQMRHR